MTIPGEFCPNSCINVAIHQSLSYLSERDAGAFRKKFRRQRGDEQQFLHSFRELLAGVFVARQGYEPQYEPEIDGLTPDWHFTPGDGRPSFIADVLNFHIDRKIEIVQDRVLQNGDIWCDWVPDNSRRLYQAIQAKAGKYKGLASQKGLPFVVFVYGWFTACVEADEIKDCLYPAGGLFDLYPALTGVYHFEGVNGCYTFAYYGNANPHFPNFRLDSGTLPVPIPPWSRQ